MSDTEQFNSLKQKTREINTFLRSAYASFFDRKGQTFEEPFGGNPLESIGPWPEFILHGFPCPRSLMGNCTPCGYSNVEPVVPDKDLVYDSLLCQIDNILDNFQIKVIPNQKRKPPYPRFKKRFTQGRDVMLAISPIGSFFNDAEIPSFYRKKILEKLVLFSQRHRINFMLFVETCAADVLKTYYSGELTTLLPSLQELNSAVLIGLESASDFVRNVLYLKDLSLEDFEESVKILKEMQIEAGAFVFAGVHSMTQTETIDDVNKTMGYLQRTDVMPVLMLSNLKICTLNHLLYIYNRYKMLDPRTIVTIVDGLLKRARGRERTEPWLIADPVGGPPQPEANPFDNPRAATCKECSQKILHSLRFLRETYDEKVFRMMLQDVRRCACHNSYEEMMRIHTNLGTNTLYNRAMETIHFADGKKEEYVSRVKSGVLT